MRLGRIGTLLALAAGGLASPVAARAGDGAFDARDEPVLAACGEGDGALSMLALRVVRRRLAGLPAPSADELTEELRATGDTRTSARALTIAGSPVDRLDAVHRTKSWAKGLGAPSTRKCGIASAIDEHGREAIVLVSVQERATVKPIPTQLARPGWITFDATLAPGGDDPHLVVLGPRGAPRHVPTSFDGTRAVGRFSADREGRWIVQLVADGDGGPRPIAEAVIHVGDAKATDDTAPGQDETGADPASTLAAKVNAARAAEGFPALARSPELDAIARAHAEAMAKRGTLAHDVGDGSPLDRVLAAGLSASVVGENVARAASVTAAHRAIWASPSHRENVLSPRFRELGVAVVAREGTTYVTELFVRR